MIELFIGAVVAVGLYAVIHYSVRSELEIKWWQWVLTVIGFIYLVFVLEVIISFLREGSPKAAMVNGAILGFVAAVWAVLLVRFVFSRRSTEG